MTEATAAARTATDQTRAEFTAALRELADYLDAHPDLPVPDMAEVRPHIPGDDDQERAEVDRIASILGVPAGYLYGGSSHYIATRQFGTGRHGVAYRVVAIAAERMAQHNALMSYRDVVKP